MKISWLKMAILFVLTTVGIYVIVVTVNTNQDETYDDVILNTTVTRNESYPPVYFDVTHEVTQLDLFVNSKPRTSSGFYGYQETGDRFHHQYLDIFYATTSSTSNYILYETVEIELLYEEYVFEITNPLGIVVDHQLIEIISKSENILDSEYAQNQHEEPISLPSQMGVYSNFRINLVDMFLDHGDYQIKPLNGFMTNQVVIPKITGYRISYTAKAMHQNIQEAELEPDTFGNMFLTYHGFTTALGDRKEYYNYSY